MYYNDTTEYRYSSAWTPRRRRRRRCASRSTAVKFTRFFLRLCGVNFPIQPSVLLKTTKTKWAPGRVENFSRVTPMTIASSLPPRVSGIFRARRHMRACLPFFTAHAGRRRRHSVAHGHYKLIRLSTDDAETATAVAPHYTKRTAAAAASSNAVSGRNAQRFARSSDCGVPESRAITGGMSAIA